MYISQAQLGCLCIHLLVETTKILWNADLASRSSLRSTCLLTCLPWRTLRVSSIIWGQITKKCLKIRLYICVYHFAGIVFYHFNLFLFKLMLVILFLYFPVLFIYYTNGAWRCNALLIWDILFHISKCWP